MRRLSKSIAEMKQHYDVLVVGSGYGAGVAASRLARSGRRVCVLERGREYAIGEFPDTLPEAQREFQLTRDGIHVGSRLGMFDMRMGRDIHVLIGCGLGGTSLINANVSLKADPRVWDDPVWPDEMAGDGALETGYERARAMLRPVPYPDEVELPKLQAMRRAGEAIGRKAVRPPVNVTFTEQINHAGVVQPACTLCGDCVAGCNVGAKSTTQVTYIADAFSHGADIFTEVSVHRVARERGTWRVYFEFVGHGREKFGAPDQSISADIVVLGAGTLGSSEILLRSAENGLALSSMLGKRFTGNGDVLAFGYNNDVPINGIGFGEPPRANVGPVGPCIAGLIDLRGTKDMKDGFVIEEGTMPSGVAALLPDLLVRGSKLFGKDTDFSVIDTAKEGGRELESLFHGAYKGAVNRTQTFLVMSHDNAGGVMRLQSGKLEVDWPGVADQPIFAVVDKALEQVTAATGGTYIKNPASRTLLGNKLVTVHPLGGCVIGTDRAAGVVNHKSQVFNGDPAESADAVHEGLYVCDGSIVPRSLGVNPLFTITGLAERAMIHLARDYGLTFDDAPRPGAPELFAAPSRQSGDLPAGVEFTERMAGFVSTSERSSYDKAADAGRSEGSPFSFTVTILVDDIDRFVDDSTHRGGMIGTVECPALSPEPMEISGGEFHLMQQDAQAVETRRFDYNMSVTGADGAAYLIKGHKIVRADPGLDIWADTSTLYVDILKGRSGQQGMHGRGIATIAPRDFLVQMQTMKGINGKNAADRMRATALFGGLFASTLFDIYGGVLAPVKRYDKRRARKKRDLRTGLPELHEVVTEDGKRLKLSRYRGGDKGPLIFSHGLGVSSRIFSIDTIDTNLLEYFYTAGYDCWLLDFRASIDLPYCEQQWTAEDVARYDYPAAVAKVRGVTGAPSVQMLVHCFGATTFFMSVLGGWLDGVRSVQVSQIAMDVFVPWIPQRLLAYLRTPSLLDAAGIDVVDAVSERGAGVSSWLLDQLIRLMLIGQGYTRTRNATANRITALYGPLHVFGNLNAATVDGGLPEMFGPANITAFKQLALISRKTHIVAHDGAEAYLPNIARLAALPISFIHGGRNGCFKPESTQVTFNRLVEAHGPELYERHVIPGYGHIDCIYGKNAAIDVYPHMLRHLEKTAVVTAAAPVMAAAP